MISVANRNRVVLCRRFSATTQRAKHKPRHRNILVRSSPSLPSLCIHLANGRYIKFAIRFSKKQPQHLASLNLILAACSACPNFECRKFNRSDDSGGAFATFVGFRLHFLRQQQLPPTAASAAAADSGLCTRAAAAAAVGIIKFAA